MISLRSPPRGVEKWQMSLFFYRYPQNEVESTAKGHTVGFSKQVRGDLVLTLTQHILPGCLEKLKYCQSKATTKHILITDCNESPVPICKDFL